MHDGNFQGLVGVQSLLLERIEFFVLVNAPPRALGQTVHGRAFAPRRGGVPFSRNIGAGPMIVGTDGAASGRKQRAREKKNSRKKTTNFRPFHLLSLALP